MPFIMKCTAENITNLIPRSETGSDGLVGRHTVEMRVK